MAFQIWRKKYHKDHYSILEAVKANDHSKLQQLVARLSGDVKSRKTLQKALVTAVRRNNAKCAEILVSSGADPCGQCETGLSDAEPSHPNKEGESLLALAVKGNLPDCVLALMAWPGTREHRDGDGRTMLHLAVRHSHTHIVDLLLSKGLDPDVVDNYGSTPLLDAVLLAQGDIMRSLVATCDVNMRSADQLPPIIHAAKHNQVTCVRMLLSANADPNVVDRIGNTALIMAGPYIYAVLALLHGGANPNKQNHRGMVPLWFAAYRPYVPIVKILLRSNSDPLLKGCTPGTPSWFHTSPLEVATNKWHLGILKMFMIADSIERSELRAYLTEHDALVTVQISPGHLMERWSRFYEWSCKLTTNPPLLKECCRRSIRKSLGSIRVIQKVQQLPLPDSLKKYVDLKELDDVSEEDIIVPFHETHDLGVQQLLTLSDNDVYTASIDDTWALV